MANITYRYEKGKYDLSKLKEGKCRVGFFESARYASNLPVATVAQWNEYGTKQHVPARPFIRPALHQNKAQLVDLLRRRYDQALRNNDNTMNVLFEFGEYCKGLVQDQIRNTWSPPNAPSTIKQKGKNTPLRDTMVMLHSVSHKEEELHTQLLSRRD